MAPLKVVQWTTGKVGTCALRAILDDPRLQLVGLYAHSPGKVGEDAGTLCQRPPCGIAATDDVAALIALAPDAVVYTPFLADLDHLERLLRAGIDVVSTNLLLNCGGLTGAVEERLEAACREGESSLLISGVNPGWINQVAAGLTAVCRRVESVTISESTDVSNYASKETWDALGIGRAEADAAVLQAARGAMVSFRDAATRLAGALGLTLDALEFEIAHARAARDVDLGFMQIPKGTFGALRSAWSGRIGGAEAVRIEVAWYLTEGLEEAWTFDADHYHVAVRGEPDVEMRVRFVAPDWQGSDWSVLTALPAVNALPHLVAARPGILGLEDVGLVTAPVGAWRQRTAPE
ncbi:hypothetical protein [Novosphingobium profundi]|uniref:NAD(P)H-dependent amine dehydrogenase family protein n=1 Tax=Novosphingobium profundi TaxID=1774954 RepID=UPI001CFC6A33|nr:hypothetical protein [Novosphingobium profundi]